MTSTTFNISLEDRHEIVARINEETFRKLIPSISFYCILSITGTLGNILSIYIFTVKMRNNPQNDLFILLSIVNLLACSVCLPLDILDMRNMYMQPSIVMCKFGRFLNTFTTMTSTITLCTLAILRLRAALSGAANNKRRSSSVVGIVVQLFISASFSWIAAIVFGTRSSPTFIRDIMGEDCSVADNISNTAWPAVFNVILCIGFALLVTVTIIAYYQIWRIVKRSQMAVTSHAAAISVVPCPNADLKEDCPQIYHNDIPIPGENNQYLNQSEDTNIKSVPPHTPPCDVLYIVDERKTTNAVDAGLNEKKMVSLLSDKAKDNTSRLLCDLSKTDTNSKKNTETALCASINVAFSCQENKLSYNLTKDGLDTGTKNNGGIVPQSYKKVWRITDKKSPSNLQQEVHNHAITTTSNPQTAKLVKIQKWHATRTNRAAVKDLTSANSVQRKLPEGSGHNSVKHETKLKLPKTSLESAITRTAFLLTLTFVISYVPFFLVSIPRAINKDIDYSQDTVKLNLINTAVRFYFIMPTISPVIFWASNLDFRCKCRALWQKDISYTM